MIEDFITDWEVNLVIWIKMSCSQTMTFHSFQSINQQTLVKISAAESLLLPRAHCSLLHVNMFECIITIIIIRMHHWLLAWYHTDVTGILFSSDGRLQQFWFMGQRSAGCSSAAWPQDGAASQTKTCEERQLPQYPATGEWKLGIRQSVLFQLSKL